MSDTKYNGWTNYATWRVALEWFDGLSCEDVTGNDLEEFENVNNLADSIQSYVESVLTNDATEGSTVYSYAMAFLSDVNWYEIAEHLTEDWKEEN
jgi:hypothetical protein